MKIVRLLFFLYASISFGQNGNYTIFSFEYDNIVNKRTHYWIIENDSIDDYSKLSMKPIVIEADYSKTLLNNCCSGNKLESVEDNYELQEFIGFSTFELTKDLKKNRKFLQKITHEYGTGLKSSLKVYATPVVGNFCSCMIRNQQPLGKVIDYVLTYIPKSVFTIDKSFHKTNKWKRLRYFDFSEYLHESFH